MSHLGYMLGRRFSAAMDPEKLKKLLQSLRKSQGYLTGMSWAQMGEVFTVLDPGWKLEKITGIVKMFNGDDASYYALDRPEAEKRYAEVAKDAVLSLPASPKPNKLYVLDLRDIVEDPSRKMLSFDCKPWMGAEGWRVTSNTGKQIDIFPDQYSFGDLQHGYKSTTRGKIPIYKALPIMKKETDWVEQINKSLNEEAHVPAAQRTREGTGSCPICFQNIKITDGENIVLHGYTRPGTGYTHGRCPGTKYPAFELSVKGTKWYLETTIEPSFKRAKLVVDKLQSDDLEAVSYGNPMDPTVATRNDPRWAYHLDKARMMADQSLQYAEADLKAFTRLVQNWKLRPLPKEGGKLVNWYAKGQTD